MTTTRTHRFGPGQFESLVLSLYSDRRRGVSGRKVARVEGTFTVYTPYGQETIYVNESIGGFESERDFHEDVELVWSSWEGSEDSRVELAALAVEYALEDWSPDSEDDEELL